MEKLLFESGDIGQGLTKLSTESLDQLEFGVIGFNNEGIVEIYNAFESKMAGLSVDNVIGEDLFTAVAPCMNNFLVAQKFEDSHRDGKTLDETIDYVLTLRMKPTKVKLRLISAPDLSMSFILLKRNL